MLNGIKRLWSGLTSEEVLMDTMIDRTAAHVWPRAAPLGSVTVDGCRVRERDLPLLLRHGERSYFAEISACQLDEQSLLIEHVIGFALDTLGAHHLELRVHPVASH